MRVEENDLVQSFENVSKGSHRSNRSVSVRVPRNFKINGSRNPDDVFATSKVRQPNMSVHDLWSRSSAYQISKERVARAPTLNDNQSYLGKEMEM